MRKGKKKFDRSRAHRQGGEKTHTNLRFSSDNNSPVSSERQGKLKEEKKKKAP